MSAALSRSFSCWPKQIPETHRFTFGERSLEGLKFVTALNGPLSLKAVMLQSILERMARGVSTVGKTESEAIQSVVGGNPELEIIACKQIDLSDIQLRTPIKTPHWVVVFEDPDPSKFVQDADPIAKITAEVRHTYELMANDPHSMPTAVIEGPSPAPLVEPRST